MLMHLNLNFPMLKKMSEQSTLKNNKKKIEHKIINVIKTIFDPEIPVDIYELGLIYEIKIDDEFNVAIEMTE